MLEAAVGFREVQTDDVYAPGGSSTCRTRASSCAVGRMLIDGTIPEVQKLASILYPSSKVCQITEFRSPGMFKLKCEVAFQPNAFQGRPQSQPTYVPVSSALRQAPSKIIHQ